MTKKGYKQTKEHIKAHALAVRGHIPWNKGLTKELDERVAKHAIKIKEDFASGKRISPTKGKHPSNETINKIRQKVTGLPSWCKGLSKQTDPRIAVYCEKLKHIPHTTQWNDKVSVALKGRSQPRSLVEKMRRSLKKLWENPEFASKMMQATGIKPTKPEIKLGELINRACPNQYKYTGDGSLTIQGLIPDYANCNGQKKVIEMFGDYWHSNKKIGDNWKRSELGRIMAYNSLGFACLVIWEHDLETKTDSQLLKTIKQFTKERLK